jgi:hypothetical protein
MSLVVGLRCRSTFGIVVNVAISIRVTNLLRSISRWFPASELFSHAEEETLARSILRCEHANAGAISELIDRIEEVDDIETHGHWFRIVGQQKLARNPNIDLGIKRFMVDIGVAAAQPAAENHVGTEFYSAP